MRTKLLARLLVCAALCAGTGLAQAASLSVTPISSRVALGDQVILMMYADFRDDPALGGGLDVFFDTTGLEFSSWIFMAPESLGDDPDFRREPDVLAGELNGIAFGNFEGMFGRSLVGFLTLEAVALGSFDVTLANNEGGQKEILAQRVQAVMDEYDQKARDLVDELSNAYLDAMGYLSTGVGASYEPPNVVMVPPGQEFPMPPAIPNVPAAFTGTVPAMPNVAPPPALGPSVTPGRN